MPRLRPYLRDDLDALTALFGDADVMRFVGEGRPLDAADVSELMERILERFETDPSFLIWAIEEDGAYAGHAELKRRPGRSEYELVYVLQRERWGRGLGGRVIDLLLREARDRRIPFVVATVARGNAASLALLRRRGFAPDAGLTAALGALAYRLTIEEERVALPEGYTDLPRGKLANVATYLEMRERADARPEPAGVDCELVRVVQPSLGWYRALFRQVGGPYLWFSRLELRDEQLRAVLNDPAVEVYAVRRADRDVGLLELDFREAGECEIAFLGMTAEATGRGVGRWLMNRTLELAWSHPIARLWVHTCTLDHPSALPYYIRAGFKPYKRAIEIYDDPRLHGLLPRDLAPEVPLL